MSKRGKGRPRPDPIDLTVSRNLRQLRIEAGMTQTDLGQAIGVSFQQVGKYEQGTDRLSASRLWQCAAVLGVPLVRLFEDDVLEAALFRAAATLSASRDQLVNSYKGL